MTNVEVKPSAIEGLGIFATHSIKEGESIRRVNVVREVTDDSPLVKEKGEHVDHCAYPDGKMMLWGYPDRHVNHSCDPNASEMFEAGAPYLVARRYIAAGEEIACDYNVNTSDGTAWPCKCGASRCGGEVVGDFFRLPAQRQREYRPLLASWFVSQHRNRIESLDAQCSGS